MGSETKKNESELISILSSMEKKPIDQRLRFLENIVLEMLRTQSPDVFDEVKKDIKRFEEYLIAIKEENKLNKEIKGPGMETFSEDGL